MMESNSIVYFKLFLVFVILWFSLLFVDVASLFEESNEMRFDSGTISTEDEYGYSDLIDSLLPILFLILAILSLRKFTIEHRKERLR